MIYLYILSTLILPISFTSVVLLKRGSKNISTTSKESNSNIAALGLYAAALMNGILAVFVFQNIITSIAWFILAVLMLLTGITIYKNGNYLHAVVSRIMVLTAFVTYFITNLVYTSNIQLLMFYILYVIGISCLFILIISKNKVTKEIQLFLTWSLNIWLLILFLNAF